MASHRGAIDDRSAPSRSPYAVHQASESPLLVARTGEGLSVEPDRLVLVTTKLRPPRVRDQMVPREHLLERLNSGSGLGLTLMACPAGFGKTSLLAAWHEAESPRRSMAWLTLEGATTIRWCSGPIWWRRFAAPVRPSASRYRCPRSGRHWSSGCCSHGW